MPQLFSEQSKFTRHARFIAILWTLLIFLGCFLPAKKIPEVDVPLVDKWVHFLLFGGFTFLWLLAYPSQRPARWFAVCATGVALGIAVELVQGLLGFLGRATELLDMVADGIGALIGSGLFALGAWARRQ